MRRIILWADALVIYCAICAPFIQRNANKSSCRLQLVLISSRYLSVRMSSYWLICFFTWVNLVFFFRLVVSSDIWHWRQLTDRTQMPKDFVKNPSQECWACLCICWKQSSNFLVSFFASQYCMLTIMNNYAINYLMFSCWGSSTGFFLFTNSSFPSHLGNYQLR